MEYIVHRRYKGTAASGQPVNLPYGTRLQTAGDFVLTPDGAALCFPDSENGHRHLAPNHDGQGLRRGALTYAVAFAPRERRSADGRTRQRFTDAEIATLERDWSRYLISDLPVVLFNDDFFRADPEELAALARAVNIKTK